MANPQLEDGFTRISNELLSAAYQVRMSGSEWQVFLFLIRITYGFSRKTVELRTNDFKTGVQGATGTGLERQQIHEAINALATKKIIKLSDFSDKTVRENGRFREKTFEIQKDYTLWIDKKRKVSNRQRNLTKPSEKSDKTVRENGQASIIRKKERYKDIKTTPEAALRAAALLAEHVLEIHPNHRQLQPDRREKAIAAWADVMRLMNERDKRAWDDITALVEFLKTDIRPTSRANEFPGWGVTVQSAGNLREKFDKIWAQYQRASPAPDPEEKSLYTKNYYEGLEDWEQ